MKNKIFQYAWSVLKGLGKRKTGSGLSLSDYQNRIVPQIKLARMMGKISLLILGDSNAENLNTVGNMIQLGQGLPGIAINIGIGGSRVDQWVQYLESAAGLEVMTTIKEDKPIIVINVGGNNALQQRMDGLGQWFDRLGLMLQDAYACLCPPIHLALLEPVMDTAKLKINIMTVNAEIFRVFDKKTIDCYTPFKDNQSGEAYFTVLQDAVHFSDLTDKTIRIPLIRKSIGV